MKPLIHTGDSSNIAFYAEELPAPGRKRRPGEIWCEVLRDDFERVQAPGMHRATLQRRGIPRFVIVVYRFGQGEVGRRTYQPRTRQAPGPLNTKTTTRLVREILRRKP